MARPKKPRVGSKVEIIEPSHYIEKCYFGQIGKVIKIEDIHATVEYPNGIKVSSKLNNLRVL